MDFDKKKASTLEKLEGLRSEVDEDAWPLLDSINSRKNYYTTSSCTGRITLMSVADSKKDCEFLFKKHEQVSYEEIQESLQSIKNKPSVWLRAEGIILHVACRDMNSAEELLKLVRDYGLKRSGIISIHPRVMIEIIGAEKLDTPVKRDDELLITDEYLRVLVDEANSKIMRAKQIMQDLIHEIRTLT